MSSEPLPQPDPSSPNERATAMADSLAPWNRLGRKVLGRDAWLRLKTNRWAWNAGRLLLLIGLMAFLTPLFPLQSPIHGNLRSRRFEAPNLSAQTLVQTDELGFPNESAVLAYRQHRKLVQDLKVKIAECESKEEQSRLSVSLDRLQTQQNPLFKLWHRPSRSTQWLLAGRLMIFGDWSLPSLFGCDDTSH